MTGVVGDPRGGGDQAGLETATPHWGAAGSSPAACAAGPGPTSSHRSRSISCAAASPSPAAMWWRMASAAKSWSANQRPARRCSSSTPSKVAAGATPRERVVPVPLPAVVERQQEQIEPLELLELDVRPQPLAGHRGAQRGVQPIEDRGVEQERCEPRRTGAAPRREVVGDVSIVSGEVLHKGGRVGVVTQRDGGQLHADGPALGALQQWVHIVGRHRHREGRRSGGRPRSCRGADRRSAPRELAGARPAGQAERRVVSVPITR